MKTNILYFILPLFLCTCTQEKVKTPEFKLINVVGCKDSSILLSEVVDTLKYVVLNVPERFTGRGSFVHSTEKYIIYGISAGEFRRYLLFDKNTGVYIGDLDKNITDETLNIATSYELFPNQAVYTDETGRYFYPARHFQRELRTATDGPVFAIQKWDLESRQVVDTFRTETTTYLNSYMGDGNIFIYTANILGEGGQKYEICDAEGKVRKQVQHPRKFKVKNTRVGFYPGNTCTYRKDGIFHYFEQFTDTVYAIMPDLKEYPVYAFDQGERKPPYYYRQRTTYEEWAPEKYDLIENVMETNSFLFFYYSQVVSYWGLYNNKTNRTVILKGDDTRAYAKRGIPNDIDGGVPFWPERLGYKDGEAIALIPMDSLKQYVAENPENPAKNKAARTRLLDILQKSEGNQVVIIANIK